MGNFTLTSSFRPELVNTNSLCEHADLVLMRSSGDDGDVAKEAGRWIARVDYPSRGQSVVLVIWVVATNNFFVDQVGHWWICVLPAFQQTRLMMFCGKACSLQHLLRRSLRFPVATIVRRLGHPQFVGSMCLAPLAPAPRRTSGVEGPSKLIRFSC